MNLTATMIEARLMQFYMRAPVASHSPRGGDSTNYGKCRIGSSAGIYGGYCVDCAEDILREP